MLREKNKIFPTQSNIVWKRNNKLRTYDEEKLKNDLEKIIQEIQKKELSLKYIKSKDVNEKEQVISQLNELYELKNMGQKILNEYGKESKPQRKFKTKRKKVKKELAYKKVLEYIENIKMNNAIKYKCITKEDTAMKLNIPEYQVEQIFRQLNIERILSQAIHRYPHDNDRNPYDGGGFSGWQSDLYEINQER